MIIPFVLTIVGIYLTLGFLTCLLKKSRIKETAILTTLEVKKQLSTKELSDLESAKINLESTLIWGSYIYTVFMWPSIIHS